MDRRVTFFSPMDKVFQESTQISRAIFRSPLRHTHTHTRLLPCYYTKVWEVRAIQFGRIGARMEVLRGGRLCPVLRGWMDRLGQGVLRFPGGSIATFGLGEPCRFLHTPLATIPVEWAKSHAPDLWVASISDTFSQTQRISALKCLLANKARQTKSDGRPKLTPGNQEDPRVASSKPYFQPIPYLPTARNHPETIPKPSLNHPQTFLNFPLAFLWLPGRATFFPLRPMPRPLSPRAKFCRPRGLRDPRPAAPEGLPPRCGPRLRRAGAGCEGVKE